MSKVLDQVDRLPDVLWALVVLVGAWVLLASVAVPVVWLALLITGRSM